MKYYVLTALLLGTTTAMGQNLPLSYPDFMQKVVEGNKGYAAEKLNVNASEAGVVAARVFNDPSLAVEYGYNDDKNLQMGQSISVELSKTFSFGKRGANINLAKSQKELDAALLEDYFHSLRAEATLAYLETLKQNELYKVKQDSYEQINLLAIADSVKFSLGDIGEMDALQTKLEAGVAYNDLMQAETELKNIYSSLDLWVGVFNGETYYMPLGDLRFTPRRFDTAQLLQMALDNRADLAAAFKNVDVANKALKVTKRERNTDVDVALGYNYNTEVKNEIAPAPKFNGVTLGVSIPLKISNTNKGAVRAAEFRSRQAELNYEQAQIEVQNAVMNNLRRYLSFEEQVRRYDNGLIRDAKSVIEGKRYSYLRGETSLLEVLDAQRTYNDVATSYIETLYNTIAALVALERSAGIWDITITGSEY
jgi:cobalt-zinc-cadmium efflux system outer membrane protein